ncbi:hypothetical protein [Streptomyces sp. NPDC090083]|uniref:hypothetical protein n=1 Tax=Streptomyces sp. NPDC090083 TaxID=3365941 RepID=UPI003806BAC7
MGLPENFDPVASITQLEAVMTGLNFEEASDYPWSGQRLSDPQGEGAFIVSLTDTFTAALASASQNDLLRFA